MEKVLPYGGYTLSDTETETDSERPIEMGYMEFYGVHTAPRQYQ